MKHLSCQNLTLERRDPHGAGRLILNDISATFPVGKINLITGETGSGKTTLIHLLAGLLRPTSGEVLAGDEAISRYSTAHRDQWRQNVGIMFQTPHLIEDLSTTENIMVPLIPHFDSIADIRSRASHAIEILAIEHLAAQKVSELSGGERQRVAAARSIVGDIDYLLADEPTAHQDTDSANIIINLLIAQAEAGRCVIVAAHDPRLISALPQAQRFHLSHGLLSEDA